LAGGVAVKSYYAYYWQKITSAPENGSDLIPPIFLGQKLFFSLSISQAQNL